MGSGSGSPVSSRDRESPLETRARESREWKAEVNAEYAKSSKYGYPASPKTRHGTGKTGRLETPVSTPGGSPTSPGVGSRRGYSTIKSPEEERANRLRRISMLSESATRAELQREKDPHTKADLRAHLWSLQRKDVPSEAPKQFYVDKAGGIRYHSDEFCGGARCRVLISSTVLKGMVGVVGQVEFCKICVKDPTPLG